MSDFEVHIKSAREKKLSTLEEFEKKRYTVVGDLAIKAVEQAIEALAALEDLHFHLHPRSAHSARLRWVKEKFPHLSKDLDELWGAYGALGYEGMDGDRARKVIAAMERILNEFENKSNIRFKESY